MPTIGVSLTEVVPTIGISVEQPNKIVIYPSETLGVFTPIIDVIDTPVIVKGYGLTSENLRVYMVSPSNVVEKMVSAGVDLAVNIANTYIVLAMTGRYVLDKPTTDIILTAEATTGAVKFLSPAYNIVTGGGLVDTYRHTQSVPSATWIINHNLIKDVTVQVLNLAFEVVGAEVKQVSQNQTRIYFSSPVTGYAFIQ